MTHDSGDTLLDHAPGTESRPTAGARRRSSPWDASRPDRSWRRVLVFAVVVLVVVGAGSLVARYGIQRLLGPFGKPATAEELMQRIADCQHERDLACVEEAWTDYLKLRPDDARAIANLGMTLNRRDEHAAAVVQFKRAIDAGEGTYDLFAYYADSLKHLGRTDDAIDWSYKALSVVPRLVDVRGSLAKLLVARHRPYEALSLLAGFDADAVARGHQPYFEGQRIAIESDIADSLPPGAASAPSTSAEAAALRLPIFEGHYFAPLSLGGGRPTAFMVDTGATHLTVGRQLLVDSKAVYRLTGPAGTLLTADGRRVAADPITIESLRIGPFELHDVPAVACDACASLLGQSTLSRFDLRSSRTQGVEFLTLAPR
jgi:predicted aspartyl protease